jgi:DNA replication protein DnaC
MHNTIKRWLTAIDFTERQNTIHRGRYKGTGEWFLKSAQVRTWLRERGQTLFCPGKPGVGKTVMASIAIHHVCKPWVKTNAALQKREPYHGSKFRNPF